MKISIEAPRQNAAADTHWFTHSRPAGYTDARRGWSRKPAANSGKKVRLKKTNIVQKWILASRSFRITPVIFGSQ